MSSEKSKNSILKAAIQAFSTKGYDSVSIRDVAKNADVNHAIIRYHFGSKNDLWLAVFQHLMENLGLLRETKPFNFGADDIIAEYREFTRIRVSYFYENPELLKIVLLEYIEGGPRFIQIENLMHLFFQGTIEIVEKLQTQGIVRAFNMKDMFFILPTFIGGRFIYPTFNKDFDGNPISKEDAIDAHTDLMMNLVLK